MPGPEGPPLPPPDATQSFGETHSDAMLVVRKAAELTTEGMLKGEAIIPTPHGKALLKAYKDGDSVEANDSSFVAENKIAAARESVEGVAQTERNPYDELFDPNVEVTGSLPDSGKGRVVTDPAELAQREAATNAAVREQRVADGKPPYVMPQ